MPYLRRRAALPAPKAVWNLPPDWLTRWRLRSAAGLPMSPRINHVGGCFDDLPEGTVGAVVVNAPSVVWAQFLQHAEADEPTEFLSHFALQDHLAGWFGLVET
jgi:hypothetical protein